MAAAASARESRKSFASNREEFGERRRKAHSIAAARLVDPTKRPTLRHASSAYTIYETPGASSSKVASSVPSTPSSFTFADRSGERSSTRKSMLQSKRSLPQLHNVWENFLQETSEDVIAGGSSEVSRQNSGSSRRTVRRGADLSLHSNRRKWRPDEPHPPLPRHLQSPSASSKLTVSTVASSAMSPIQSPTSSSESVSTASPSKSPEKSIISSTYSSPSRISMMKRRSRIQGRGRGSTQTTSSEVTSSISSSSFSVAGFSSMSSITSVEADEPESGKVDANHPDGRYSRGETRTPESNSTSDFSSSIHARSLHSKNSSSGSISSSSRPHITNGATPRTPIHTPNTTTTSLPPTPPLSRSSSRSLRLTPKPSAQLNPGSSLPSTPFASSHASIQWRGGSPPTIPDYHFSGSQTLLNNPPNPPRVPGSSKPSHFSAVGLTRVPSTSDSSDACSTGEDFLSELEYYYPRRQSPGSRRSPGLPATPAPLHRRRLTEKTIPRSKSTSNIRLVAGSEREDHFGGVPSRMGHSRSPAFSSSAITARPSPGNLLQPSINHPLSYIPNTSSAPRDHRRSGSNNGVPPPNESFARPLRSGPLISQSLPPSPTPTSSFPSFVKSGAGSRSSEIRMPYQRNYEDLPASAVKNPKFLSRLPPPVPPKTTTSESTRQIRGPSAELYRTSSRPGTASSANVEWGYAL